MNDKILVTRPSMPIYDEYIKCIKELWDSAWLTNMGKFHNELENSLIEYLKVDNISLFSNGHMALELLLQALELTGEVITTPYTFASTTHAIVRNNLKPVFCDIDYDTYTMDAEKIESLITKNTSAILPVHVYGNVCNVQKIERIAKKYNLKVIYDAAHAFGVKVNGEGIANFGDASIFSFHATKVFNTIEGGAVAYSEYSDIGKKLYELKNFGIISETEVTEIGTNAKLNEFQAVMGICNLKYINDEIEKRKNIVERYIENLQDVPGIKLLSRQKGVESNYAYFPIVIDEKIFGNTRDQLCVELKKDNIFTRKYFFPLTSEFACYKGMFNIEHTPVAKYISERVLTLPLYASLELKCVDKICEIIKGNSKYEK